MTLKMLFIPILAAALLALANFSPPPPSGPCDSPLVGGHTGAPGETSCTGCHGGTANIGPGNLTLTLSDTTLLYTPGEMFDATVVMKQAGREKFGFVGLALKDAGNTTIGTFTIDDMVRTRTFNDGARKYVSHTPCGADAAPPDSLSWTFHWKAPTTTMGNITLYLAGLAANHNHALSGDDTYTLTVHLVPDTILLGAKEPVAANRLRLWPNPASNAVFFAIEGINSGQTTHEAEIWSADGRLLCRTALAQNKLSVADLEAGIYRLRVIDEGGTVLGQTSFVKQ